VTPPSRRKGIFVCIHTSYDTRLLRTSEGDLIRCNTKSPQRPQLYEGYPDEVKTRAAQRKSPTP